MALNNLPSGIQNAIQTGFLERYWMESLTGKLGFRDVAERKPFPAGIGESWTSTRGGLFPMVTTPMAAASNADITDGLTPAYFPDEQFTLTVQQYAFTTNLNLATSEVAIASIFAENVKKLAEGAARSVDGLAKTALFNAYLGQNTRTTTTATSATQTVDDNRGFAAGQVVAIGSTTRTISSVTTDGSNTSTAPGGVSGTLVFTASYTGTSGDAVIGQTAPLILRPNNRATTAALATGDLLTTNMVLAAKAQLSDNGVAPLSDGYFRMYCSPSQAKGLYADTNFQSFSRGQLDSDEYRKGVIAEMLGVKIVETNMADQQVVSGNTAWRALMVGDGALVEGVFTNAAYAATNRFDDGLVTVVDGIAHIIREPIGVLKQSIAQSWSYIGGFCVPTDINTTTSVIPTAGSSNLKRGVTLESL